MTGGAGKKRTDEVSFRLDSPRVVEARFAPMTLSELFAGLSKPLRQTGHEHVWVSLPAGGEYFQMYEISSVTHDHPAGGIVLHIRPMETPASKG